MRYLREGYAKGPVSTDYAPWFRRALATSMDTGLCTTMTSIVLGILGYELFGRTGEPDPERREDVVRVVLVSLAVTVAYTTAMLTMTDGRTIGRAVRKVRVVRRNGRPMTLLWSIYREVIVKLGLFGVLLGLPTFGLIVLIDVLWPLWDRERRALHDFLCGTRVVRD